jgi:hypothetical protein
MTGRYPHRNGMQTPFCAGLYRPRGGSRLLLSFFYPPGHLLNSFHAVLMVQFGGRVPCTFFTIVLTALDSSALVPTPGSAAGAPRG